MPKWVEENGFKYMDLGEWRLLWHPRLPDKVCIQKIKRERGVDAFTLSAKGLSFENHVPQTQTEDEDYVTQTLPLEVLKEALVCLEDPVAA